MTTCVLKDLIEISKDGEWGKGEPFDDSLEMLAIRGTDFDDARFGYLRSVPRRHIAMQNARRKTLQPWDIVIEAAGGTKGHITGRTVLLRPQLFQQSELPITCASFSRFIRFKTDLCDPEFMFWYLQSLYHTGFMHAYHTQHTGVARFQWTSFSEREPLKLPPISVQRRISKILSAYDELIYTNQRQIRVLEETARSIYREWFILFRFPGHENVKLVSSPLGIIPQGWDVVSINDVCECVTDGSHHSPKSVGEGLPMASSKDMHDWGLNLETCRFIKREDFDQLVRNGCKPKKNDVLITKDGANYLKYIFVNRAEEELVLLSSIAILRPNLRINPHLLAAILKSSDNKSRLKNYVTGAAIPRIVLKDFKRFQFILPSAAVQARWAKIAEPMTELCWRLVNQIQNLCRTRDLLLPRLLSEQVNMEQD
jgi:type I restriction enzyme S subunit